MHFSKSPQLLVFYEDRLQDWALQRMPTERTLANSRDESCGKVIEGCMSNESASSMSTMRLQDIATIKRNPRPFTCCHLERQASKLTLELGVWRPLGLQDGLQPPLGLTRLRHSQCFRLKL
jgi:hypothetical protein|mmetsp:Transcript_14229/g.23789  ORF Transcript_14229/g.23789 Transcript_14229/m.23789 type:complete len:121 (-) Transcript_14229:691-1053(-)